MVFRYRPSVMIIVVFLGNPGKKYTRTRHNAGFIVGEKFAHESGIKINKKNFMSETGTGIISGKDVLILFPQTFMNLSGQAVKKAMDFYNIQHKDLVVIHDELELPFGEIRTKFGGGHKGHNGLRSIIAETGSPDFHRIRIGIGRPTDPRIDVSDHVLSAFTAEEFDRIDEITSDAGRIIRSIIEKN